MREFNIGDSLHIGWEKFKDNVGVWIGPLFVSLVIFSIGSFLGRHTSGFLGVIISIAMYLLNTFIAMGFASLALRTYDQGDVEFSDFFYYKDRFYSYLAATIVASIAISLGMVLLIVPGVFAIVVFSMFPFAHIDQNLTGLESLKRSYQITEDHRWQLFGFLLVVGLLNFVGSVFFIIGLFITVPVTAIAAAHLYRRLTKTSEGEQSALEQ
ncbi:MAG: hypothetical protein ACOCUH_04200 [Bacteriovoracia bacterium]